MNEYRHSQIGYFLKLEFWQQALRLLNFQISQKKSNRHYNTLSIFYYEKLDLSCLELECQNIYYRSRVASGLFYALEKEFFVHHYVIPKQGLGLRDYVFFSYPMRALYYSIGLYLLRLSKEFLSEVHGKLKHVKAFYGGNLHYKGEDLIVNKTNIYYRGFYEQFRDALQEETEIEDQDKDRIILKLDIENYFGEISIPLLLHNLEHFIKPIAVLTRMRYSSSEK
jgi:hypothetical protein